MTLDILGVGDAGVDLLISVPALGDTAEKVVGTLAGQFAGGMTANFCCCAARLGARAGLAAVVGTDSLGDFVRADLENHGVDTRHLVARPGGRTFLSVVRRDGSGRQALTVARTGCAYAMPSELRGAGFGSARLVHLTAGDLELASWAAGRAREAGALVCVDADMGAAGSGREDLLNLLRTADLVCMNRRGFARLTGTDPAVDLRTFDPRMLGRFGPGWVAVTLGAAGAVAASPHGVTRVAAPRLPVADSTGAGDCFAAALAVARLAGEQLPGAVRYAVTAASLSVTGLGGHSAAPTDRQVRQALASGRCSRE